MEIEIDPILIKIDDIMVYYTRVHALMYDESEPIVNSEGYHNTITFKMSNDFSQAHIHDQLFSTLDIRCLIVDSKNKIELTAKGLR